MTIVFIIITLLWIGEFIFFPSLNKEEQSKQKSFRVILAAILSIILVNALMAWQNVLLVDSSVLQAVALVIYASGLVVRFWALIMLGNNFSRNVEVSKEQELISHGPYKYVRHPSYTGLFLLATAVPLFVGNVLVFILAVALMYVVLNRRMKEEESFMEEVMGERYVRWKNERYKLLPFII
ncbi:MAG: isoprenylcysteine carboxylmethyltransferase family protein [Alkalibacterium sp.]|nr:isoprenylcysteine carboxylmethyltransferase family protein [Alkalibacterium sp.]